MLKNNNTMPNFSAMLGNMSHLMNDLDYNVQAIEGRLNGCVDPKMMVITRNLNQLSSGVNQLRTNLNDVFFSDVKALHASTVLINQTLSQRDLVLPKYVLTDVASNKSLTKDVQNLFNSQINLMLNNANAIKPVFQMLFDIHIDAEIDTIDAKLNQIQAILNHVADNVINALDKMLNALRDLIQRPLYNED